MSVEEHDDAAPRTLMAPWSAGHKPRKSPPPPPSSALSPQFRVLAELPRCDACRMRLPRDTDSLYCATHRHLEDAL